jgi:branched-subunit amino acid transport protein
MTDGEIWLVIVLLTCATALTRSTFIMLGARITIAPRIQEALRYAPACALAAIIVPDILLNNGGWDWSWHNHKLLAGVAAIALYLIRRDMLLMIVFGMLLFTALRLWA